MYPQGYREDIHSQKQLLRLDLSGSCTGSLTNCCGSRRFTEIQGHTGGLLTSWGVECLWLVQGTMYICSHKSAPGQFYFPELSYSSWARKEVYDPLSQLRVGPRGTDSWTSAWLHNRVCKGDSPCFLLMFPLKIVWLQFTNVLFDMNELITQHTCSVI